MFTSARSYPKGVDHFLGREPPCAGLHGFHLLDEFHYRGHAKKIGSTDKGEPENGNSCKKLFYKLKLVFFVKKEKRFIVIYQVFKNTL